MGAEARTVEVLVGTLPAGKDPGDLAQSDPEALVQAVDKPVPFLKFRVDRTLHGRRKDSPEHRVRLAEDAMAVVNEHPNSSIRNAVRRGGGRRSSGCR